MTDDTEPKPLPDATPCPRCYLRGAHECLRPIEDYAVARTGEPAGREPGGKEWK